MTIGSLPSASSSSTGRRTAIFYLLEANPNPQIAKNEDSADSAAHCGLSYPQLLQKILMLGVSYSAWSDPGLLSSSL